MGNAVTLVTSASLPSVPYAHAAIVSAGAKLVFLAGSCPLGSDGRIVAVGDVRAQTAQCLDNLESALDVAGASIGLVIATRISVATADRNDLAAAWQVVERHFGDHAVPSTLVGVTVLGYPDQLVEIEAFAAVS